MEILDGYFKDGTLANIDLIRGRVIPNGIYHLVCEVLVQHTDGDYLLMKRDLSKPSYGGYYEATAGGSALKGEDKITCIKRELFQTTLKNFRELEIFISDDDNYIFYTFSCATDWDKTSVKLQDGEIISYK